MGPIDWIALIVAALAAVLVDMAWYRLFVRGGNAPARAGPAVVGTLVVMLLAAWLMGHNFARVGADTLAAKPWLYWMMSGGFALFIAAPAVWLTAARHGASRRSSALEAGCWLAAFLAMGTVFWALG